MTDAQHWNQRFTDERSTWLKRSPDSLLETYAYLLPDSGRALDAACGVGTNTGLLTEHGLEVVAVDFSPVALSLVREHWSQAEDQLKLVLADMENIRFAANSFDIILNFNYLARTTFKMYMHSLKPGGVLFFSTFVRNARRKNPDHYLMPGELQQAFRSFEIMHSATRTVQRPDDHELPVEFKEDLVVRKPIQNKPGGKHAI